MVPNGPRSQIPGFLGPAGSPQELKRENHHLFPGPRWPSPRAMHTPFLRPQGGHSDPSTRSSSQTFLGLGWATPRPQHAGHRARTAGHGPLSRAWQVRVLSPQQASGPENPAFPAGAHQPAPEHPGSWGARARVLSPQGLQLHPRHLEPNKGGLNYLILHPGDGEPAQWEPGGGRGWQRRAQPCKASREGRLLGSSGIPVSAALSLGHAPRREPHAGTHTR